MPSKDKPTSIDLLLKINKTTLPTSHLTLSSANTHTDLFCARHRGWSEGRSAALRPAYAFRAMCIIMSRSLDIEDEERIRIPHERTVQNKSMKGNQCQRYFAILPPPIHPRQRAPKLQVSNRVIALPVAVCLSDFQFFFPPWVLYSFWFIHSITHVLGYLLTSLVFKNVKSDWVQIDALRNGSADMITSWKISKHWVSHRLW